jgi:acyl-CoA reductase-like NAD-dependent aldehyde dehydrogenase
MATITQTGTIKTITTHYIDGALVESHGREVMDILKPTNGQLIGRVTLGDEEDTRRAIAAAKRALASFSRTTKEERSHYLRQLHKAVSARIDDLTAVMIEEYGGVAQGRWERALGSRGRRVWSPPTGEHRRCVLSFLVPGQQVHRFLR